MGLFDRLKQSLGFGRAEVEVPEGPDPDADFVVDEGATAEGYRIRFILPGGKRAEVFCQEDEWILDAGLKAGLDLPYSCRSGACSTCAGRLKVGSVDQSQQAFLDDDQLKDRYLLPCSSNPRSACIIYTHREGEV